MIRIFKIEIRRAFTGIGTWISFGIGMLISMIHIVHWILPRAEAFREQLLYFKSDMQYPDSLYWEWICGNTYNPEGFLYFLIFPLLAVLPYSISFFNDKDNGYIRQVYMRAERRRYLMAKSAAVFLTGGFVVTAPLLINFIICAMFLPALPMQQLAGKLIYAAVVWYKIFEQYPLVYVMIFMGLDFIFAGLVACLPLLLSFFSEKRYVILLMPFVLQIFIYAVCMMSANVDAVMYSTVYLFFAGFGCRSVLALVGYIGIYGVLGVILFWKIGNREDIF
ncbi:vacuolar protein sorting 55 [Marvinbryantia formatexigens DSM 14469]|uniref:Vacuolar protein sorting 55 n=1 Tax=Marvinbryantia formatexigens DSM 14469 TaxID=478749 RepID=C6L9D0_9FIRM|nr:hypothetical protein [Marvinbryantia formatexigens]EET62869.1 vacuolar protein sorting 55 [Marvinbryantia formatexigens DSM 14469]UWO23469.1 hypothetical protein NQ534_13535 [Marvinbryantia formatexigens DSM 14469]SDG57441.1 hypothetical protein SAMN05660368_02842 [Marvinbryantia formatexigens]